MEFAIAMFLIFLIGACVGSVIVNTIYMFERPSGTLKIDHTNPEKDSYLFEIDDLDDLTKRSRIILKIRHESDLSQK
jgi:hypothetical protein